MFFGVLRQTKSNQSHKILLNRLQLFIPVWISELLWLCCLLVDVKLWTHLKILRSLFMQTNLSTHWSRIQFPYTIRKELIGLLSQWDNTGRPISNDVKKWITYFILLNSINSLEFKHSNNNIKDKVTRFHFLLFHFMNNSYFKESLKIIPGQGPFQQPMEER